ncbi:MAG: type II toxin-antitoxin system prevent-host-death family antitoxin [Anaerolineae bacterium]|nr:type II toxin-antitoxin system prevent-host-death family antitoxin [Anaerolineae bacterium]
MSTTIDIHQAKANLSRLLVRVSAGEEIIIASAGKPVARLVGIEEKTAQRLPGTAKGQAVLGPDFDAPWSEDLARAVEA